MNPNPYPKSIKDSPPALPAAGGQAGDTEARRVKYFTIFTADEYLIHENRETLFGRNTQRKMRWARRTNPLLLGSSFKKRCGNFDRGTPWAKCPQHSLLLGFLCASVPLAKRVVNLFLNLDTQGIVSG
jgi:hypothetical protein